MSRPKNDDDKLELSAVQLEFVDAYFQHDKSPARIARALGWPDRGRVSSMLKSQKVAVEIARRTGKVNLFKANNNTFKLSRSDRLRLLWSIAKAGIEQGYDARGNMVMVSPQASISAIREFNLMMGDNAPTEIEVAATVDNRTEAEIRTNIQRLIEKVNQIPDMDRGTTPFYSCV